MNFSVWRQNDGWGAFAALLAALLLAALLLAGCGALEPEYETRERQAVQRVGQGLGIERFANTGGAQAGVKQEAGTEQLAEAARHPVNVVNETPAPALPQLDAMATQVDYLRFALLNHPRVRAAFYRWWAQVEAITPARSLPDPALVFQTDITNTILSLMPGLMLDIPAWGMLEAAGEEAAAVAQVAYRQYVLALQETAAQLRSAWAQLIYATERLALGEQTLIALEQSVVVARAGYSTGFGEASLQAQAEQMNAQARASAELEDRRDALLAARARFKSALGLGHSAADPHWPSQALAMADLASVESLWAEVQAHNPRLAVLRATADAALAQVAVADKEGNPAFAIGLMADVKHSPVMFRPELGMTLPVWRDKVAALLASAEAGSLAAQAELSAAELELAAELAQTLAALRGSERRRAYLQAQALPAAERALASADVSYRAGSGDFSALVALQLLRLQVQEGLAQANFEYALALSDLALLAAMPLPAEELLADR